MVCIRNTRIKMSKTFNENFTYCGDDCGRVYKINLPVEAKAGTVVEAELPSGHRLLYKVTASDVNKGYVILSRTYGHLGVNLSKL